MTKVPKLIYRLLREYWLHLGVGCAAMTLSFIGYALIYQRPYVFSYAGSACFRDVTVLPGLYEESDGNYALEQSGGLRLGGHPIITTKTCIVPKTPPEQYRSEAIGLRFFGAPVLGKQFRITPSRFPVASLSDTKRVSVKDDLLFKLDQQDTLFEYRLKGNGKVSECRSQA